MSLSDFSRTLVTLVKITLPWCTNTFGSAPCTATGTECFNTFHTCKDRLNFASGSRTYSFSSALAPLPFPGPRPYVKLVTYLPTEITTNLTKTGRIKVDFVDEPDTDVGVDPYVTNRALYPDIPGTFFRKLIARNPNYKGATLEVFEGVLGDAEAAFVKKAHCLLETAAAEAGRFTFESIDLLAGLGEKEIPAKTDLKLLNAITAGATDLILATTPDTATLATSGYLRIADEIIEYTSYDLVQRRVYGCIRGSFGTTADAHKASDAVQPCRYFPPGNPFDHLKDLLLADAAYDPALVDTAAFDYWRDWPGGEVPMSALFSEPVKMSTVYMGLVDLLDCRSWVAEDLTITISRNIPNAPGRSYVALSDAESVIKTSPRTDLNEISRKTRCAIYWEKAVLAKHDDPTGYSRIDIGVNAEAETEYGDTQQDTLYCPWLYAAGIVEETLSLYVSDLLLRRMFTRRDAAPIIQISVDPKDGSSKVGEFATFTTDEICNPDGTPVSTRFQVVKRDPKGSKIDYKLQRMPARRGLFYADTAIADYSSASAAEREYGGWYCDETSGLMPNGDDGFLYY